MTVPQKVLQVLWSGDFGGSERHVLDLVCSLSHHGFSCSVCFLTKSSALGPILDSEGISHFSLGMRHGLDIFALFRLRSFLKKEQFDVIHEHGGNKLAIDVYKLFSPKSKTIFTIHNGETVREYKPLRLWAETRKIRKFDRVLCVSLPRVADWQKQTGRVIYYEPNALDTMRFSVSSSSDADAPLVSVGRLIESKRFLLLISLLSGFLKFTGRKLLIVGDGPLRASLEKQIRDQGLEKQVFILGNRDDVPEILKKASVFVFASQTESFGLSALEAACAGLPVVAIRNDGLESVVVDNETGFLISEENALEEFPKKVALLLENDVLRRQMGLIARSRVLKQFSLPSMVARVAVHYTALLENVS